MGQIVLGSHGGRGYRAHRPPIGRMVRGQ
jgi:hypothetical protein